MLTEAPSPGLARPHAITEPSLAGRRILHVCTRYARGGSEQRLRDMLDAAPEAEHHIIVGRDSDAVRLSDEFPSAIVRTQSSLQRSPHPIKDAVAYRAIRKLLDESSFDLVCTHQSKAGFLGRLAARGKTAHGAVHSLSMANFGPGYSMLESALFRGAEQLLARYTRAYAVVGEDLAGRFSRIGVRESQIHVIRSAARLPVASGQVAGRAKCSQQFGLDPVRPWVLYLGSLEPRKNVLSLPVMLQQLLLHWGDGPAPMLVVAGDGPLREELSRLLDQMDLAEDSMLLGHVADPGPLLAGSDVLVLLSSAEGLPQVLVQASAVELPFAAYEVDGVDELLRMGASGRVVEQNNVLSISHEVHDLLVRGPRHPGTVDLTDWERDEILRSYRRLFLELLTDGWPAVC